ncbi:MAG: helix-turn-helix transcriptional regulator [Clostridiaceae bacterium]
MDECYIDKKALTQIMDLIEQQCGPHCEIVLHDLSQPYDKTIADIRNGHITGRKIGDCGSNLGLEVIRGTIKNGDKFNYITHARDGKILRSSSIYLRDKDGVLRYSLCINLDISDSVKFETYLKDHNRYAVTDNEVNEIFVNNVQDLLSELIKSGSALIGKELGEMDKNEKIRLLEYLDNKGAFLISKSGERLCDELHISKYTFYSYLDLIRGNDANGAKNKKASETR